MKSCVVIVFSMMLFLPVPAFIWKLKPPVSVQGILGENLTLEWKFSLVLANENFDYFALFRNGDDMIKYSNDGSLVIYSDFIGLVGMARNGTPAFTLLNLQLNDDKAKFCCKVGTKSTGASPGNIHKHCVTLKLLVRPSIMAIPANITLKESNDVILSCNATGTPPPNVTWSKSGNQDNNVHVGSLLPLRNISRVQDGLYWCTAENRAGKSMVSVRVIVQFPPSIVYISHDTLANEADDVKLFCNSTGNPRPNITWTFLNGSNSGILQSEESLVLPNVTRNQAGIYKCTADNGIMVPSIANVQVAINFRPSIMAISGNITLNESNDVILSCNATGNPPPNVTWSKSGEQDNNVHLGSLLQLRNISRAQDGLYWCTAENRAGKSIASVRVIVQFPPSIVYISHDTLANEADDVKLFCNSTGNPRPNITWTFLNGSNSGITQSEESLVLSNVTRNQAGIYKCTADNGIMVPSIANVQVAINFPPFIEYISTDMTVNETDGVMLSCNSTGNPRPNITWTSQRGLEASTSKTGETLFLSDVSKDQAGAYGCTADNGVMSSKTVYVHITVNYMPEIKDVVRKKLKSWINHETKLRCEAEGIPAPDIIWTRNDITISPLKSQPGVREIMITPKNANDFGDYVCTAKNLLGSTQQIITIEEIGAPEAPEILQIDTGVNNMEIHWQASISNPEFPVLDYLVRVEEKDEPNWWKNCTRFQTKGSSQMCVVNELRSATVYIVQIAARNVVGYSPFTKTEAQTRKKAGTTDAQIQEQQQLSKDAIHGIIGGVIGFCSLVVVIVAIVTQRRPCNRGCNKSNVNKGLEGCINDGLDGAIEESPQTAETEDRL